MGGFMAGPAGAFGGAMSGGGWGQQLGNIRKKMQGVQGGSGMGQVGMQPAFGAPAVAPGGAKYGGGGGIKFQQSPAAPAPAPTMAPGGFDPTLMTNPDGSQMPAGTTGKPGAFNIPGQTPATPQPPQNVPPPNVGGFGGGVKQQGRRRRERRQMGGAPSDMMQTGGNMTPDAGLGIPGNMPQLQSGTGGASLGKSPQLQPAPIGGNMAGSIRGAMDTGFQPPPGTQPGSDNDPRQRRNFGMGGGAGAGWGAALGMRQG